MEELSFHTTGEAFTALVRDMWISHLPKPAIQALDGLDNDVRLNILTGKMRFEGDTRVGDHTLQVVDDNTEGLPSETDVLEAMKMSLARETEARRQNAKLTINLNFLTEFLGLRWSDVSNQVNKMVENLITQHLPPQEEETHAPFDPNEWIEGDEIEWDDKILLDELIAQDIQKVQILQLTGQIIRSLHPAHRRRQAMQDDTPRQEDTKTTMWDSGWISPSGKFWGCMDLNHIEFTQRLLEEGHIKLTGRAENPDRLFEKNKWVKLSAGRILWDETSMEPNKNQWKAVLRYMSNPMNEKSQVKNRIRTNECFLTRQQIEDKI